MFTKLRLEKESVLQRKVTLEYSIITFPEIFKKCYKQAHISLIIGQSEDEFNRAEICCYVKDDYTYRLMDGIATLYLMRWEKKDTEKYVLLERIRSSTDGFSKDLAKEIQDYNEAGKPFLQGYNKLPTDIQEKMRNIPVGHWTPGYPVKNLPPAMIESLVQMAQVGNSDKAQASRPIIGDWEVKNGSVKVKNSIDRNGIQNQSIQIEGKFRDIGMFTSGWSISNVDHALKSGTTSQSNDKIYAVAKKDEFPRSKYSQEEFLQKRASVVGNGLYITDAIKQIHDQTGISFISDTKKYIKIRKDINLGPMQIYTLMDKLMTLYTGCEWEYRKLGVLVVRSPENPQSDAMAKRRNKG
jgi:hypothetical protein